MQALLEPHATEGVPPTFLWRRVQAYSDVIHVPPSGIWGYGGRGGYTAAAGKVRGTPPGPEEAFDQVVRTYLGAFGPATKQDVGQWAGVPRMKPIAESLERLSLRSFASEDRKVLYDLPRAPLPDPETPAPPRLVPRFDNLVLSHADRSRILGDLAPSRIVTNNGLVHATILVDGLVAGTWQLEQGRVVLEPFGKLGKHCRGEARAEGRGGAAGGIRGLTMSRTGDVLRSHGDSAKLGTQRRERGSEMTRYLLAVNFDGGVVETPMEEWKPEEIEAHLDYYKRPQRGAGRQR